MHEQSGLSFYNRDAVPQKSLALYGIGDIHKW